MYYMIYTYDQIPYIGVYTDIGTNMYYMIYTYDMVY